MATPTAINLEVFELYKRVKAIDPTFVTGLEGSYLEIYKGELDHLERMYVQSDFRNKVAGSTIENPNIAKGKLSATLDNPSTFTSENNQANYDLIMALNGTLRVASGSTNGQMACQLFSFDILSLLERRYGSGVWKGATTLADKVTRAKAIITKLVFSWWGYGSSPTGNKSSIAYYTDSWWGTQFHTNSTVAKLTITNTTINVPTSPILSNGFVNYIAYAEPSNGTVASVINTDYIQLEVIVDHSKL